MQAVNNYIIVQKIKQGPKTVGGLILTEDVDADNRYIKANVISVGNLVEGINEKDSVADPKKVVMYGNLGYCQLFKFKCAGDRTCDAWVHGGPICS